jgi:hypothetical protein
MHKLHDLDKPSVKDFSKWAMLLKYVWENKVTGYAVDSEGEVVNFRKGKRKGVNGKWIATWG